MDNQDLIIRNGPEAIEYLTRRGYRISKSKFYRDVGKGLIRSNADRTYQAKDLESYARRMNLVQPDLSGPNPKKVEELHEVKLKKEIEKLEWENKKRELEFEKEQAKYIPRADLELELASRAAVLDSGLRSMIKSHARTWIDLVGGDRSLASTMTADMFTRLDHQFNIYARMDKFIVIFGDENEEAGYDYDSEKN